MPALYMTPQCAEKALKAFLIFKGINPGKIHELRDLVNKCITHDKTFNALKEPAIVLNPYNLGARYPDSFLPSPDTVMITSSIKSAVLIFEFIKNKID